MPAGKAEMALLGELSESVFKLLTAPGRW